MNRSLSNQPAVLSPAAPDGIDRALTILGCGWQSAHVKADTKQVSILVIAWFTLLLNTCPYPCSTKEMTFAIQAAFLFCPSDTGQQPSFLSLAKQHRIIAKVDEILKLCDELETQLITAVGTRRALFEAT